jgi:hypothetical protein
MTANTWPRLSQTLQPAVSPGVCQRCGDPAECCWQEHDEHDRPEPIAVPLCRRCADELIDPHPRLYRRIEQHEPFPGAMPTCMKCALRSGTRCTHPSTLANGGTGLEMKFPEPSTAIVCSRGHGCRNIRMYSAPVQCTGRRPIGNPQGGDPR